MDVSVIIVAGDELEFLKECVHATGSACEGVDHELIVMDNASSDGTSEWITATYPQAKLLRQDRRVGLSEARNKATAESRGDFLLFLDADARILPAAVRTLLDFMRGNPEVGIAGPRITHLDGRFQESCRPFQTWRGFLRRGLRRTPRGRDRVVIERAKRAKEPFEVDWVMGACQMVRRRAVDEVGPMDEGYRLYYGDVDWCWRMKRAGWKVCYVPAAECVHRYQRRSARFPPNLWTLRHIRDFLRFRRRVGRVSARRPQTRSENRARILYLSDILELSGPPLQYARLVRNLDRTRFDPVAYAVLVRGRGDEELAREIGLPLFCFRKRGPIDKYLRIPLALRRMLRSMRIDLVHSELFKMNLLAAFVGALTRAATVIAQTISYHRDPRYSWWDMLCYKIALRLADRTIANSEVLRKSAVERHGGPPDRVRTVYYALDPAAIEPSGSLSRADFGIAEDADVIATVARLVPEKGHSVLLRAIARLGRDGHRVIALLVGDGPERASLERETRELGIEKQVRFLGTRRDFPDILAVSDLLVLPSFFEGLPMAVMEAMAIGVPVVATAVDGTTELVEDGRTGRLVSPGDEAELARAISEVLADRGRARRMAETAREEVRARFTIERMVRDTQAVYEEALARKRAR